MKDFFKYLLATLTGLIAFSVISVFVFIGIIGTIASMADKEVTVKSNSVLHLKIQGDIVERKSNSPFEDFVFPGQDDQIRVMGLNEILSCIDKASRDESIKGILINPAYFNAGTSTIDEIRDAIFKFKESGKFVVAYAGNYTQKGYYLASAADKVYMNPQGILDIRGLAAEYTFFKKGLDKLGIDVTIFKVGTYKSAIEPFMTDKMSDPSREQTTELINDLWNEIKANIAVARGIEPTVVEQFANDGMAFANQELGVTAKLLDDLKYTDQVIAEINTLCERDEDAKPNLVQVKKYAKVQVKKDKAFTSKKIALVYAQGGIDDGSSDGINSAKLSESIREARQDSTVKAIVLRVNSPGGSAFGSEQIWREVELAKEGKPVIISMGDVAASGGYYIACAGHTIMARPTTITGSIGIFGMIPNFKGVTDKLGITFDGVKTNEYADLMSVVRPMNDTEKRLMQAWVERGYATFTQRCADGRNTTTEAIDKVGQGRVWSGLDAKEVGLVDKFGGINDAIALAAEMAGLENYRLVEYPKEKEFFQQLMEDLQARVQTSVLKMQLGEKYELYRMATKYHGLSGLQARMPFGIDIN